MTQPSSMPWWRTDTYDVDQPLPAVITQLAGPKGVALVKAYDSGQTQPGWGLRPPKDSEEGFMPRYLRDEFNARRALYGYTRGKWAFAIVMRSVQLVCIDIDGKNGGLQHAKRLGPLPKTLAETSKSGDGYHLFYSVDEKWDVKSGFGLLSDRIGLEQGVDIRATGCVYHYPQQRWNGQGIAPLPAHLFDLLNHRERKHHAAAARIEKILENNDPLEVLMLQDELESELAKPIPQGKRNNTLFAIGSQLYEANVPGWEAKVEERADQLGLDSDEIDKLVANIKRYGDSQATP